ncbi:MAD2L1-binding protein [Lasioglossum baleicum]|uniref:MAD2L1-binding protein n=1 Tax=Lasioglossum baleicum TaxID=434251 RepID=UPI003FCE0FAE
MDINVELDEPLTTDACVKLVIELLKYILYQKQQIPFTYDSLTQLQTNLKPMDRNSASIKTLLKSLKDTSEQLSSQFHLNNCKIKEIAIIIGATIISPKLHIRLELPSDILNSQEHYEYKHASRKPLLNLMRSMLECSEFQDAISSPMSLTNTFVLVRKSDRNSMSEFFLPKPQYTAPVKNSKCFIFKLHHNSHVNMECNCIHIVKIYNELAEIDNNKDKDKEFLNNTNENIENIPYQWYQSRELIKGFKFIR